MPAFGNIPLFIPQGSASSSSGGGGGSSIIWEEQALAPTASWDNNVKLYLFEQGLTQYLYTVIRVPQSYTAGNQINLRALWYSAGTSNNALLQTLTTLIRSEVDAISSTTNQRTSTNAAVTLSAGTANEPQKTVFDLTDASGQVNSVAVSAGDLLIVRLTRGSDTSANDINFVANASEVTFS